MPLFVSRSENMQAQRSAQNKNGQKPKVMASGKSQILKIDGQDLEIVDF